MSQGVSRLGDLGESWDWRADSVCAQVASLAGFLALVGALDPGGEAGLEYQCDCATPTIKKFSVSNDKLTSRVRLGLEAP